MPNLQELHDHYLKTKPNAQKVQRASQLLVRLCKQLNLASPEEINPDLHTMLPKTIDEYYKHDFHKAIQDKSMLAEMIGRFGPIDGWEKVLEVLLNDEDSNLRQFSLQSLEYCGKENLDLIIYYIEKYKDDNDELMQAVSARLTSKVYSEHNEKLLLQLIQKWTTNKNRTFLENLKKRIETAINNEADFTLNDAHKKYFSKLCLLLENN